MNTPDIIESLNMAAISPRPLSNALLHQISAALMERDALRTENERLTAIIEASTGECLVSLPAPDTDNAKLLLANKAIARTNEQLRAALVLVDIAFQGIYGGNAYEVLPIETMTEDRKRACDAALEALGDWR